MRQQAAPAAPIDGAVGANPDVGGKRLEITNGNVTSWLRP
jgi:hypothetical protein